MYTILRTTVYLLLLMEFLVYVPFPFLKSIQGTWAASILNTISGFLIYENLVYSRLAVLLITCVCSIGTKAKKDLEFDPTKMVAIPFILGLIFTLVSIFVYPHLWSFYLFSMPGNFTVYMLFGFIGTIMMHVALDNISKSIKHGLMKDRMNWENESFMQETKKIVGKDAINIPTLFYYKGKMHKGWINIEQPFRGRRRTNRVIFVKLIYWLKLNVNHLKSVIWVKQRKITGNIRNGMTSGWLGTLVGNSLFCFPEFPRKLRTLNGFNPIILPQFGTRN